MTSSSPGSVKPSSSPHIIRATCGLFLAITSKEFSVPPNGEPPAEFPFFFTPKIFFPDHNSVHSPPPFPRPLTAPTNHSPLSLPPPLFSILFGYCLSLVFLCSRPKASRIVGRPPVMLSCPFFSGFCDLFSLQLCNLFFRDFNFSLLRFFFPVVPRILILSIMLFFDFPPLIMAIKCMQSFKCLHHFSNLLDRSFSFAGTLLFFFLFR